MKSKEELGKEFDENFPTIYLQYYGYKANNVIKNFINEVREQDKAEFRKVLEGLKYSSMTIRDIDQAIKKLESKPRYTEKQLDKLIDKIRES